MVCREWAFGQISKNRRANGATSTCASPRQVSTHCEFASAAPRSLRPYSSSLPTPRRSALQIIQYATAANGALAIQGAARRQVVKPLHALVG